MGDETGPFVARILGVLELFVGLGAVVGGVALVLRPDGLLIHMPLSLLGGTPFESFLVPGLVLLSLVGAPNVLAGVLSLKTHPSAATTSVLAGAVLTIWMIGQMSLIGYHNAIQLLFLGLGVIIVLLGLVMHHVRNQSVPSSPAL